MWIELSGPNGEVVLFHVVADQPRPTLVDMTVDPAKPMTNLLLFGGGWTTVAGRPHEVADKLDGAA